MCVKRLLRSQWCTVTNIMQWSLEVSLLRPGHTGSVVWIERPRPGYLCRCPFILIQHNPLNPFVCHLVQALHRPIKYMHIPDWIHCNLTIFLFFGGAFLAFLALLTGQLKIWQETGWEIEWHAAKGPRPGVEPGSAAARTKPLYIGSLLYPMS